MKYFNYMYNLFQFLIDWQEGRHMILKQGKHKIHLVTDFYTRHTNKHRYVVEPLCLPGLFLIKDPKKMHTINHSFRQLGKQKYYAHEQKLNPMNMFTGTRMRKITGNYEADGYYLGSFQIPGPIRPQNYVIFEFESPPGLLHIFREEQLGVIHTDV